jgi:signal transduction histidine kinase
VPVDLADIARATAELLSPLAEERNITIHIDGHPAPTNGDPDRS